jgi:hypothetical protein
LCWTEDTTHLVWQNGFSINQIVRRIQVGWVASVTKEDLGERHSAMNLAFCWLWVPRFLSERGDNNFQWLPF